SVLCAVAVVALMRYEDWLEDIMNSLSWHLAWRYLRRHPRRKRFAFSTVVSVAGVALGVGALMIVMGVLTGLEDFIEESVITVDSPVTIMPDSGNVLHLTDDFLAEIEILPSVSNTSPFIQGEAIIRLPSRGVDSGCRILGVDQEEFSEGMMGNKLSYGELTLSTPEGSDCIIMGIYLAEEFFHPIGDTLFLFPPKAFFSSRSHAIGRAILSGAVETGLPVNDETLAYISLDLAQRMYLPDGGYSGINVHPAEGFSPEETVEDIREILPASISIKTWKELNPDLTASMKLERMGAFLALLLITLVATFNIIGTISRSAIERMSDISVLKAMGATDSLIFRIFLWEGALVGVIGVFLGLMIGLACCWVIGETNIIQLPDVYSFHENIPVSISIPEVVLVGFIAFLLSIGSGVLPAMKAARLDPVKGLES
ncbi:MAG: ABC transporter permease, partial [Candidatus Aegiribacteria sp.]|nr:ABC transporter permease [Candidatus Aegiribacteria sp.]